MQELHTILNNGPCFLFLGQNYLKLESSKDILLSQILKKYNNINPTTESYSEIFNSNIVRNRSESYSWMHSRCYNIPIPIPLKTIANFPWNGIFTSSFDDIIDRAFRNEWREIQTIFNNDFRPQEPRNRHKLNIWHLYGSLCGIEQNSPPPLSKDELWQRQATATVMSDILPELVTQLGVLIFEGYDLDNDWFTPEQIFPIINKFQPGHSHIFSFKQTVINNEKINHLIENGKLVLHEESLANYLNNSEQTGKIKLNAIPEEISNFKQIRFSNKKFEIPSTIWRKIQGTATLIEESEFYPIPQKSKDKLYADFRTFLLESSTSPSWEGFNQGFAFKRNFEDKFKLIKY